MAANTDPIYPKKPRVGGVAITAGNTRSDGVGTIGTDIFLAGTAGPDGAYLRYVELWPTASVAATNTTVTVARAFLSTQSSGATSAANTNLAGEVPLIAVSASSSTAAAIPVVIVFNRQIAANQSVLFTNHVAPAANTAWKAVLYWGDYDA
jgi:hypothetical protein